MSTGFGPSEYRSLIADLQSRGYTVRRFAEAEPRRRDLVLRHDIDISLAPALPMGEIENALGVAATYFVMVRSELYNPFTDLNMRLLMRLLALGHDIGLHLDAALYNDDLAALDQAAATECAVLEALCGHPISMISFHRPAKSLQGLARTLAGRHHAYEARFFGQLGYCSDSRGAWHHGHPLDHPAVTEGHALQLLTHPIWWQDPASSPQLTLDRLIEARLHRLDVELAEQCQVHVPGRVRLERAS